MSLCAAAQAAPAAAQEAVPPELPAREQARALLDTDRPQAAWDILRTLYDSQNPPTGDTDLTFMHGLAALLTADTLPPGAEKQALLDLAIASFRRILINHPELARVRLELARAFFEKRQDSLAERHFRLVLAGDLPPLLVARIQGFINAVHTRRRWRGDFSFSLAPDTNINSATSARQIRLFGLPFQLNEDARATSGVGVIVAASGEYRAALRDQTGKPAAWRNGGSIWRRDHAGHGFDDTLVSIHSGPQIRLGQLDASLLASARRRWIGRHVYSTATGVRLQASRRIGRRWWGNANVSWHHVSHRTATHLNGPRLAARGVLAHTLSPTIVLRARAGWSKDRARDRASSSTGRRLGLGASVELPRGFTLGGYAQIGDTRFEGRDIFSTDPNNRRDTDYQLVLSAHNRAFTILGFSPRLFAVAEERKSNAPLSAYERISGELGFIRQF